MKLRMYLAMLAGLAVLMLAACGGNAPSQVKLAPLSSLPLAMQNAPATVREAYQFAVANPEAVKNVPCYCGCGVMGHTSNYACYVKGTRSDGTVVFDDHALGCSICVDITRDVMRLTRGGKTAAEIRESIVSTYSRFGPSNQP